MAEYEDLVELGFEGIDRFALKYHDKVYGHLPAWRKKQQQQEKQQQQHQHKDRDIQVQSERSITPPPAEEFQRQRSDSPIGNHSRVYHADRDMSSYANAYAPNARQDYRDERDIRYVEDSFYYKGANAGDVALARHRGGIGQEFSPQPFAPPPPVDYGYDGRRDMGYAERGRPAPSRQRSSTWSPPRREKHGSHSKRRHRSRSRSIGFKDCVSDKEGKRRLAATIVGGVLGGYAGNQALKGQKFDTVGTMAGAILGGIASRELAERVGSKKKDRRESRDDEQEAWEQKFGKDDGRRDDRSRGRDSRR